MPPVRRVPTVGGKKTATVFIEQMAFAYRLDYDDQCNWNRYKYAYEAQFGDGLVAKTCAARIELPREDGGNLRDGDSATYFVYAEYRVAVDERTIFIDKFEAINFDDKRHIASVDDRVVAFFADEVLRDRHAYPDFYVAPADALAPVGAFDDAGPPVDTNAIDFEIKTKELVTDRTVDFAETDMKKLTLAWFAPDPDSDFYNWYT